MLDLCLASAAHSFDIDADLVPLRFLPLIPSWAMAILCEVRMLTCALCLRCFPLHALASSHNSKTCILIGECDSMCVVVCLYISPVTNRQSVCGVPRLSPDDS